MQPEKQTSSKGSTLGLALLVGVIASAVMSDLEAFWIGAVLGALLAQIFHLRGRVQKLDEQLQSLRMTMEAREPKPRATPSQAAAEATAPVVPAAEAASLRRMAHSAAARATTEQVTSAVPPSVAEPTPAATAAPTPSTTQPRERVPPRPTPAPLPPSKPPEPDAIERLIAQFMGWLKGGNPLARIGIIVLFFGAAFLAKYAAENSLFPIELRFVGIALGAFALLIVGWRLRDQRPVYAEVLQGGGIAGLYLTVFAATRFDLLPTGLAFGLMIVIVLAAAILAVGQNALSLAVIGTAGGFLAPIMVSTGSGNFIALFSYYAVLNLGVFAVAWFRTWKVLNVLGFLFTFTITGLWRANSYQDVNLFAADSFLILFFVMYVGVSILNCVRQPPDLKGYVSGSLVFGLPVVAFGLHASMISHIEYAMAWSAFALGAFYLLLGWVLFLTRRESFRLLVEAFAALGVIFASLAIPLAFDTRTTAAMWAVEGAGLLWLGVRQERKLARAFGALLQIAAGMGYLTGMYHRNAADLPVLNGNLLGAVMLSIAGLCSGYWLFRHRERQARYEVGADAVFTLWGVGWWLLGGLREVDMYLPSASYGGTLSFVAVTVALLAWIALKRVWRLPLLIATALPPLFALFALAGTMDFGHPFIRWGAVGWLLLFVAHFWMLRLGETRDVKGLDWLHAGATWVFTLIVAWEASYQVADLTTGVWALLPWGVVPALVVAWLGLQPLRPQWPVAAREQAYRIYGALPAVIAVGAWIFMINLSSTGDSTWLPYLPLLNPLDISVALCFASLAMWWSSLNDQQRESSWSFDRRALIAVLAGLAFVWLNAALIRSLHHNFGAPITLYGMAHSTLVQASISIFWGLLGFTAMALAARQHWRYVWMVGAALMIVVVAKLFLVDLSNVGTLARITSFLTVGALLLVTGYLAPLPPRKVTEQVTE